ncbi:lipoprotein [Spiroplasma endosymbiont of Glossina fuscipes fuscipes]|uniref:lipoprotein n=1 Tax=Spiroplasma endosymbiont of Glossina fuscipes fuscipes TaxID=2004463 RepID=UPI003C778F35
MKRLLSIIGAISLLGTSTTSLVACNKTQEYTKEELEHLKKENQINTADETIKNNLEWIAPQEKPFNNVDNKYYYVVWKGKSKWYITKLLNNEKLLNRDSRKVLKEEEGYEFGLYRYSLNYEVDLFNYEPSKTTNWPWRTDKGTHFKAVYRWNLDTQEPDLIIDENGNIKVNGE